MSVNCTGFGNIISTLTLDEYGHAVAIRIAGVATTSFSPLPVAAARKDGIDINETVASANRFM